MPFATHIPRFHYGPLAKVREAGRLCFPGAGKRTEFPSRKALRAIERLAARFADFCDVSVDMMVMAGAGTEFRSLSWGGIEERAAMCAFDFLAFPSSACKFVRRNIAFNKLFQPSHLPWCLKWDFVKEAFVDGLAAGDSSLPLFAAPIRSRGIFRREIVNGDRETEIPAYLANRIEKQFVSVVESDLPGVVSCLRYAG
jgi:hypothetical protein